MWKPLNEIDPRLRLIIEAALATFFVGAGDAVLTVIGGGNWEIKSIMKAAAAGGLMALVNLYRHKPGTEPPKPQEPPKT